MRIVRDPQRAVISPAAVVSIGNFDGVHLGHQALLQRCREHARPGEEVAVVTFEPLPKFFFDQPGSPPRLSGAAQRLALLAQAGVDLVWAMRFNGRLAAMPAREFVERVLVKALHARQLVLGGDFRFGRGREGGIDLLREYGQEMGFGVEVHEPVVIDGQRVSSTGIRQALAAGELAQAARWLGRPYALCGRVVHGRQVGRVLGYPTANIRMADGKYPAGGVFAVRARLRQPGSDGPWLDGVASIGVRPAVGGGEPLLEVHLFDFSGDLYGQRLETRLLEKIRDEANFASLDALKQQMHEDENRARQILASDPHRAPLAG
jgi:riboflavin kinase/FMN adenylyltransferase